jgi:hypothetical protein
MRTFLFIPEVIMWRLLLSVLVLACSLLIPTTCLAAPLGALAKMPVNEITVFKDGHAFVLHEGELPTDADGNVVLDYLPAPVLGTFWPYSLTPNVRLVSVAAGQHTVLVERTCLTLRDLVEANPGAEVTITDDKNQTYRATVVGFLQRTSAELAATAPPNSGEHLTEKSNLVQLKLGEGVKVMAFDQVRDVKFLGSYKTRLAVEERRNVLKLHLDWAGKPVAKSVKLGMFYLQKGVRWIPNYLVNLDGKGKATVKLQATLLNELCDLEKVVVNLVVGVPSFQFKDTLDPIALSQKLAQLSPYFDQQSAIASNFSNGIMTQAPRMAEERVPVGPGADLGPDVAGSDKREDLFVYTVKSVSLAKGQRMALPVSQTVLDYKDVYVLDVPFAPPPELRGQVHTAQQQELARLLHAPKAMHKVRLANRASQPLTTAPALIVQNDRALAQGMMTYTAAGASTDLAVTTAVDIRVKKTDQEVKRTPNAATLGGEQFWRVDLAGTIELTNFRSGPIEIEVVRNVLGNADEANLNGKAEMVNRLEDGSTDSAQPSWWGWYSWPGWWRHFNGVGRITWTVKMEPGKGATLTYKWHYYWR